MFNDCKDAEKYNNIDDDEHEEVVNDDDNDNEAVKSDDKTLLTDRIVPEEKTKQNTENDTQRITTKLFKLQ